MRVFYATIWFVKDRSVIVFMFQGHKVTLSWPTLAGILGIDLANVSLHQLVYDLATSPYRTLVGGTTLYHDRVCFLSMPPFPAQSTRPVD